MTGYTGKILKYNLSNDRIEYIDTLAYAERFVGGRGIATALYRDLVNPETGASSEENCLIMMTGPMACMPAVGGSRWGIFGKSPLPERDHFCYGNLGGYFGAEMKFAGYDGIVITGKAERLSLLELDDGDIRLRECPEYAGLSAVETIEVVKADRSGSRPRVLAVGPAGEAQVPFSIILADGDASCSGGMGAIMGSKNLKAVTVRASERKIDVHDRDGLREIERRIRGFDRGNVKVWGIDFMEHGENTKKLPCYGCMANCLRVKYTAKNGTSGKYMCQARFFYMSHAFGYGGDDPDIPFHANRACDRHGVDTWEIQDLIEWLVACRDEGILDDRKTGLPLTKIGSLEFIDSLLESISRRSGFGEVLAKGARKAAEEVGGAAIRLARHNDPYDPRYCMTNALIFPFETREPIQQLHEAGLTLAQWSSWAKEIPGAHISSEVIRGIADRFWGGRKAADFTTFEGKAEAAVRIQNRQLAKECLVVCDWMYPVMDIPSGPDHVGDPGIEAEVLRAATGLEYDESRLALLGERVFNLQRAVLLSEGHKARKDDFLRPEWHHEPLVAHVADPECIVPGPDGTPVSRIGAKVDMPDFLRIRDEYYGLRGWDVPTGLQTRNGLQALDLGDVADSLDEQGLLASRARRTHLAVRTMRMVRRVGIRVGETATGIISSVIPGFGQKTAPFPFPGPSVSGEDMHAILQAEGAKYNDPLISDNFAGWNKTMQYVFTDTGEYFVVQFSHGSVTEIRQLDAPVPDPEIRYEMDSRTMQAMNRGSINGLEAYQRRLLRLKASFTDMMKLQSLNNLD